MAIKYERTPNSKMLTSDDLQHGKFYRNDVDKRTEPTIYLATDELTVVTLDGIQYRRSGMAGTFVEVQVDITVGADA